MDNLNFPTLNASYVYQARSQGPLPGDGKERTLGTRLCVFAQFEFLLVHCFEFLLKIGLRDRKESVTYPNRA